MKKYELINEAFPGTNLLRFRALRDFGDVKKGDLGDFVESERNLSHDGGAWVVDDALVDENAQVGGCMEVCGDQELS